MSTLTYDAKRQEREKQTAENAAVSFQKWLARPETKLLLSMVPQAENQDAVSVILRSAFDAGSNFGQGDALGLMVEALLKAPPKDA
jgi:hypothetical protein